ncbi:unnamed protein product, partial [Staurois parvus]
MQVNGCTWPYSCKRQCFISGVYKSTPQGWTDNSWGPCAIGDHGAPVSLPKLKKAYEKRYQGHLMGPPTDPGPSGS